MTTMQIIGLALVFIGAMAVALAQARALDVARANTLALRMELAAVQRCVIRGRQAAATGDTTKVIQELDQASKTMLGVALIMNQSLPSRLRVHND